MSIIIRKLLVPVLLVLSEASYLYSNPLDTTAIAKCAAAFQPINDNCFQSVCLQGPRGPRGKRGHTGKVGPTGSTGATGPISFTDELFINADMMIDGDGTPTPNALFSNTYGSFNTPLDAWRLIVGEGTTSIGAQYVIPSTLDTTQPVTLILHCFQAQGLPDDTGDVQFQIQLDYKSTGQLIGNVPPATGYAHTVLSDVFTVTTPIVDPDTNLLYFTISTQTPIDQTLMTGCTWGFINVTRLAVGSGFDGEPIYLTAISLQYTKTNG